MNEEPQSVTQQLYQTLLNQNQVLAEIIAQQQILHAAVTGKNWEQVERTLKNLPAKVKFLWQYLLYTFQILSFFQIQSHVRNVLLHSVCK